MLFGPPASDGDHPWYATLRATETFPEFRRWCEDCFARYNGQLDRNFADRFRRETPARISELFFADAFGKAGWEAVEKVAGFDLSYALPGGGRLLVEVTTPNEQSRGSWNENENDGITIWQLDEASVDAALLRLTNAFSKKERIVRARLESGDVRENDFVVIAISGLQITQRTPVRIESTGNPPEFARAFLPIGSLIGYFDVKSGEYKTSLEYSAEIPKAGGGQPVRRTAFLESEFAHVHAVAYSVLDAIGVEKSREQVGVLHNPMSHWEGDRPMLRLGSEYAVLRNDDGFTVERIG